MHSAGHHLALGGGGGGDKWREKYHALYICGSCVGIYVGRTVHIALSIYIPNIAVQMLSPQAGTLTQHLHALLSTRILAMLTKIVHSFPKSLYANVRTVPYSSSRQLSFTLRSSLHIESYEQSQKFSFKIMGLCVWYSVLK
jgi:hypothetical protein